MLRVRQQVMHQLRRLATSRATLQVHPPEAWQRQDLAQAPDLAAPPGWAVSQDCPGAALDFALPEQWRLAAAVAALQPVDSARTVSARLS
jgi:hypothetical protein